MKSGQHCQAFVVFAGSTKPETSVRENLYQRGHTQFLCSRLSASRRNSIPHLERAVE